MTKAIRFHATGGPEVLRLEDVDVGEPGPGEVRIRNDAIAVNYRDILVRRGTHRVTLPSGLGLESAGTIEAIGADVSGFSIGERVACVAGPDGAYAETRRVPAARVVQLPDGIDARHGRRDDDPRHDGALSAARDLQRQSGRHDPGACGGRRRRR